MSDLYLIAHKVRGEPAFDVAHRLRCGICHGVGGYKVADFETGVVSDYEGSSCIECDGEGFWWIIPTSGHRAIPYWHCSLDDVTMDYGLGGHVIHLSTSIPEMPPDWPDHYTTKSAPKPPPILDLIRRATLGITRRL